MCAESEGSMKLNKLKDVQFAVYVEKFLRIVNAYEIDKKQSGYYVNMYFEAPAETINKVERTMRIDDEIMRYLTLKYDAKMLRHRELVKKNAVPDIFAVEEEQED